MGETTDRRWWRRRTGPEMVRDVVLAALLSALTFVPAMAGGGLGLVDLPARAVNGTVVLLALGQCVPLVLRRRAPALCLAVVGMCFAVFQVQGSSDLFSGIGLVVALYSVGAHQRRSRVLLAVVASAAYVVLVAVLRVRGAGEPADEVVTFYVALVVCWGVGRWVRRRRADEVAHREAERAAAAAAERTRIARELHDVVTHHVTAVVVQAEAAAYLTERGRVDAVLGDIATTGRQALLELRHQLGVLQAPTGSSDTTSTAGDAVERAPALEPLEDVVARARASGQPVSLVQHGLPPDLPGAVALAVHRVVQEGLTNALKHAPSCGTAVTVRCTGTGGRPGAGAVVDVEVLTEGPAAGPRAAGGAGAAPLLAATGSGRGLAGLAERVGVLGGHLEAARRPEGAFSLHARIPVSAP